ncbi:glutamate--cysteine ligase [Marinomonas mediterranea]|uniref:Glutamate--cysteine ligase n=1 Tax=Marinomonas mediterranea (strain ATCC 700492 / JCM 21426 / NBRC 103028 / MMB-1) TaxID=717774 RepID=F2K130_MARM1|nr:glutamate--cysteine ligase [Marinomonas mediterranea]ADZ89880.1 glutamate/cysteine ligase [Marinomonas mediterranea MMB-1]WCN07965.1 glutamate--cysteine ligase [Marinomonas mediterranea]WCN12060.1 glutamate--cysteine ligase [Marinomonas mediterranea]WCN16098.1 glutamate--cysteine ligase [Marinomonas mediterranea MMB-1]
MTKLTDALEALSTHLTNNDLSAVQFHRGVEREALRINAENGRISQQPHPEKLGSALTHDSVTTDYSEALLEFITGVHPSVEGVMTELESIHHVTQYTLASQNEYLWPGSMPCNLSDNSEVPIAYFGESNTGKLKRVYREGLSNRYGRIMQCIAGMHYNFSFDRDFWRFLADYKQVDIADNDALQEFKSSQYFALIRNFRRSSWALSVLFGASSAVDSSFLSDKPKDLDEMGSNTWVGKESTSLRMSDLGYQNKAQDGLYVCYNEVNTYIQTIKEALKTPYPAYQNIGTKVDGEYKQLSCNLLQIENEYYSDIRPKRVTMSGEHPSAALQQRGVEYIEVRIMDLDPDSPIGMTKETLYFLDTFLVYCALRGDEKLTSDECQRLRTTQQSIAKHGQNLSYEFDFGHGPRTLNSQLSGLLNELSQVAEFLTLKTGNSSYVKSIEKQKEKLDNPKFLPSSKLLESVSQHGSYQLAMEQRAKEQQAEWLVSRPSKDTLRQFEEKAISSIQKQQEIEASDQVDFDTFLNEYLKPQ